MENEEKKENVSAPAQGATQKKSKSGRIGTIVGAVALAVVFFFIGWFTKLYTTDSRMRKLSWLIDTLDKKYYRDVDLNELYGRLYDTVIPDEFSTFYTADEFAVIAAESEGNNENLGIAIERGDFPVMRVALVLGNSSADVAGIKVGMYIYRFGLTEETLEEGGYDELSAFLRGKKDVKFLLECGFDETDKALYTVSSSKYLASYCTYADAQGFYAFRGKEELALTKTGEGMEGLPRDTAYIRLTEFNGNAAWEFAECMNKMAFEGKTDLVLDLRCNGGGALNILQSIASYFTKDCKEEKPVVVTARYRNGKEDIFRTEGNYYGYFFDENSKITVLADENSASASEALIGAMIDYGAIGYGDVYLRVRDDDGLAHTYGKGVMQKTFVTLQGDAFVLTTAQIFWPKGNNIHGKDKGIHEKDGAKRVEAPLFPAQTDEFLVQVFEKLRAGEIL